MKLLLLCEGTADEVDLKALTVRVLHEAHLWMIGLDELEDPLPAWLEYEPGRAFLRWSDIDRACERYKVPPVQRLGRGLGYRAAYRALLLLSALPSLNLPSEGVRVVMVHDSDRVKGWRESLEQARADWLEAIRADRADGANVAVALGVAHPEHEAWVLAAFEPQGPEEEARLGELRRRLSFDPTVRGERLSSGRENDPNDAKKALRELCPDDDRRRALLRDAPLERLHSRGEATGLRAFLDELRKHVPNAFGGPRPEG
jgi:hypothetical protein